MQNNTAILIFANTPAQEVQYKPLGLTKSGRFKLAQAMLQNTRNTAQASGLPIVEILSTSQRGNNFAQRYTNAIAQVFSMGYDQVISVGTDCPELSTTNILNAYKQLQYKEAVLGLAKDGGAYLIGLSRKAFNARQFENSIPWQTSKVAGLLIRYFARNQASVGFLPDKKTDIDNTAQLYQVFSTLNKGNSLFYLIRQLLTPQLLAPHASVALHGRYLACLFGLRAPPSLFYI